MNERFTERVVSEEIDKNGAESGPHEWENFNVEKLVVGRLGVLIKSTAQAGDWVAKGFMFVTPPSKYSTVDSSLKDFEKRHGREATAEEIAGMKDVHKFMNEPQVFRSFESLKFWFDNIKLLVSPEERRRVANFIGIDDSFE